MTNKSFGQKSIFKCANVKLKNHKIENGLINVKTLQFHIKLAKNACVFAKKFLSRSKK